MQLLAIYENTGYKMHELLEMSIAEFNSILFSIVGKNKKIEQEIEEQKRQNKNST
jgi:hypothetical protein